MFQARLSPPTPVLEGFMCVPGCEQVITHAMHMLSPRAALPSSSGPFNVHHSLMSTTDLLRCQKVTSQNIYSTRKCLLGNTLTKAKVDEKNISVFFPTFRTQFTYCIVKNKLQSFNIK